MGKAEEFLKDLNAGAKGFYQDAKKENRPPGMLIAERVAPEPDEVAPVYARMLKRYGGQSDSGSFDLTLQSFAEQTVAISKCLAASNIRIRGPHADRAEKFFSSENLGTIGLFPAVVSNQIIAGMLDTSLVSRLAAFDERVNAHSVEKITMADTADDRTLKFTGEGANMPKTKLTRSEGVVRLYKYGRVFEYTYESMRLMSLNLITAFLQRVGAQIGLDETDDLIETLIAGDGTTGSAITDSNDLDAEVSATTDYDELIRIFLQFGAGYNMTDVIVGDTLLRTILNMSQVQDPDNGFRVLQDGVANFRAFGADWHRWRSTGAPSFATDNILAIDKRIAIGILREGDFLEESDKIIDRQINQTAMSEWVGYQKLDNAATVLYDGTA